MSIARREIALRTARSHVRAQASALASVLSRAHVYMRASELVLLLSRSHVRAQASAPILFPARSLARSLTLAGLTGLLLLAGPLTLSGCTANDTDDAPQTHDAALSDQSASTDTSAQESLQQPASTSSTATHIATHTFTAMDTAMSLRMYASDDTSAQEAAQAGEDEIRTLEALLAAEDDASEIAQINRANGTSTTVSDKTFSLIDAAVKLARATEGAFDPTIYPLTHAWGFTNGNHRVPTPEEISACILHVDYETIALDASTKRVTLDAAAQLDVGAIAKGFAADCVRERLQERGITCALLDLGGNITALGTKPDNTPWSIGIADPAAPDQLAGSLSASDVTVSTSGAYQRYFTDDAGNTYHHLIDPATGYPATSDLASVSVICEQGTAADALSTAMFVMGSERAQTFCKESALQEDIPFEAILITNDGTVYVTQGIASAFTPSDSYTNRVVVIS